MCIFEVVFFISVPLLYQVEDVTKKYVKAVEEACKLKEKEILGTG